MEMISPNPNNGPRPTSMQTPTDLENLIRRKGESIFNDLESDSSSIFNKDWWYGRIMDWSMKNERFKTQMFRFVDVLPYLNSSSEVARHLKEYFADGGEELPGIFNFGLGLGSLAPGLLAGTVKKNVEQMAKMFITGESPQGALPVIKKSRKNKICFTADLLGEATLSEKEALEYQTRYLELIKTLAEDSKSWDHTPQIDEDENGPIPKVNVSVKVTSLYSQIDEAAWEESLEVCKQRLRPILYTAKDRGVFINLDMEQYAHKDFTLTLFRDLLMEPDFRNWKDVGVVIQAYLRDSLEDCRKMTSFAKERGTPFTIRLVKGAYWDYETLLARQNNWPIPVFTNKKESDANYERCTQVLIDAYPHIRIAVGSHNVRSIAAALVMAEAKGLPKASVEVQMLYGMAEPIKRALIKQGHRVREYATIGELIPGMAYLVRRLLENTSNESFLRSKFAENVGTDALLANPAEGLVPSSPEPRQGDRFENEPLKDFAIPQERETMRAALKKVESSLNRMIYPQVGGRTLKNTQILERVSPAHPDKVIARIHLAEKEDAETAVKTARMAFARWQATPIETRASHLDTLADLINAERANLTALQVFEVGKTWAEADADVAEAIDFCRYYARDARRLGHPRRVGHAPGEMSLYEYRPRGVTAVIAPWNFPLAILTGMVAAAVVTGNTVIMKPAEQSTAIAAELYRLLLKAGIPNDVVSFLPGLGEVVGDHLVNHPQVDIIAFTGSRAVGLHILKRAAEVHPGQHHIKKCIIEMGGKNAIVIDSDADLDEAVDAVLYSAFGFAGQKCSACSRVIVLESIYDRFLDRLVESAKSLNIGMPENPRSYMGPVVDDEAYTRIQKTIESAKSYAQIVFQGQTPKQGCFVAPTIFAGVDPKSDLAQEEIFGPVLAVIRAKDLDQALEIANGTAYALTGGLFSRSPATIERVRKEFEVGNLYINRGNTGALVDRHPFGGFKLSGVGSKTGGPDYLLQFVEPRVVTENTMRRGFAPTE